MSLLTHKPRQETAGGGLPASDEGETGSNRKTKVIAALAGVAALVGLVVVGNSQSGKPDTVTAAPVINADDDPVDDSGTQVDQPAPDAELVAYEPNIQPLVATMEPQVIAQTALNNILELAKSELPREQFEALAGTFVDMSQEAAATYVNDEVNRWHAVYGDYEGGQHRDEGRLNHIEASVDPAYVRPTGLDTTAMVALVTRYTANYVTVDETGVATPLTPTQVSIEYQEEPDGTLRIIYVDGE